MYDEEPVEPQETIMDQVMEEHVDVQPEVEEIVEEEIQQESTKQVPLSALQKERKKRQEAELKAQWLEQQQAKYQQPQTPVEDDSSKYESATREDLNKSQLATMRVIEERLWIKQNPEKYEKVNEYLPQFLKQRPNLASAIDMAENRYEEAYTLMEALTPKQKQQLKAAPSIKKDAPGSPTAIPKAASLNQAVDVMNMDDSEFKAWRQAQKRR